LKEATTYPHNVAPQLHNIRISQLFSAVRDFKQQLKKILEKCSSATTCPHIRNFNFFQQSATLKRNNAQQLHICTSAIDWGSVDS
jgi:hypothetical protein